jgi:hypothetical protein
LRYQPRSMATSTAKRTDSGASSRSAGPVVRRRPRRRSDDPIPVVSGRFNIALVFICAMVLFPFSPIGQWLKPAGPANHNPAAWSPGSEGQVRVTIVTGDYELLTCASPTEVKGTHCALKSKTEVWPAAPSDPLDDNKAHLIQPYRTTPDNKLVLIAGLWANPAVAMRLHREPPRTSAHKKPIRFTADCRMKFIGKLEDAVLRWNKAADWVDEGPSAVAQPISCKIAGPDNT